ncbi:hypothetical protein J7K43_06255 [Candidatus Calescamantes bacterium]|nr:hypothetical protein [Candidatus Calescamantes bacterium]
MGRGGGKEKVFGEFGSRKVVIVGSWERTDGDGAFAVPFPQAGKYYLWLQTRRAGGELFAVDISLYKKVWHRKHISFNKKKFS